MNGFLAVADLASGTFNLEESRGTYRSFFSSIQLVADARLDNRCELSTALASWLPDQIRPSDADLILASYLRWGERCPEHLLGDFSFCLWDSQRRTIFCARDPLGIKPFYYAEVATLLLVSSDAGQILEYSPVSRHLNLETLAAYLTGLTENPATTFFMSVSRLPPGHRMTASLAGLRLERYWTPNPPGRVLYRDGENYTSHFQELLRQAVRDRLQTSEPIIGVSLSGGLDSSAVAALAQEESVRHEGSFQIRACSLIFNRLSDCDERPFIEATATELGLRPLFVDAEQFWFLGDEEAYTPSLTTPALSWDGCFRQVCSLLYQQGAGVLLTGHGADTLLQGSFLIYVDRLRKGDLQAASEMVRFSFREGRGWRSLYRSLVEPLLPRSMAQAIRWNLGRAGRPSVPTWISPAFALRTGLVEKLATVHRFPKTASEDIYDKIVGNPTFGRSVEWWDRLGAPFGLEVRHPFLDRRIVEFILSIPPQELFSLGAYKPLLRRAMTGLLPETVRLRRHKTRLGSFVDFSLREQEAARIEQLFVDPLSAQLGITDARGLREAFRNYRTGVPDDSKRAIWYAITVELWLRRYFNRPLNGLSDIPREAA